MFGLLVVCWVFTRHIFYSMVCYSIFADIPQIIGESCWKGASDSLEGPLPTPDGLYYMLEPFLDSRGTVCFGHTMKWMFLSPLLVLQGLNIFWLGMIVRVALRVLRREGAQDSRSDDEEDAPSNPRDAQIRDKGARRQRVSQSWRSSKRSKTRTSTSSINFSNHQERVLKSRIGYNKDLE